MPGTGVTGASLVRLRPLSERRDGDGWVIGRIETGDFVSVPDEAHRVVDLLTRGRTVAEAAEQLRAQTGTSFAVADFVAALDELGFVAVLDGQARAESPGPRPSLPWLRPRHVRWLLHWLVPVVVVVAALVAVAMLITHPALVPSARVLVWTPHAGLVLAANAAVAWLLIAVHELAHLATARAAGAPARITLSTRLQFLTAQTDVSGVWAAPRRTRMTVYLAGMGIDICVAAAALTIAGPADPPGPARAVLAVVAAQALLSLPLQFLVFMRTDVYFVLQDLSGCANLYADGSACLRRLGLRVARGFRQPDRMDDDPGVAYPARQRRIVRVYSVLLVAGTVICLGVELAVTLPALVVLVVRAVSELGSSVAATVDGGVALVVLLGFQAVWAHRWWYRHHDQARSVAARLAGGGSP